ncbi:hypothetical protein H0H93_005247, partial [Arthromyces matolae]
MNLIRPRILISASLISLALLVVSATPIPSSPEDVVMSGVNDHFPADSTASSELPPYCATASARTFNEELMTIGNGLQKYTSVPGAPPPDENSKWNLLQEMHHLKNFVASSKEAINVATVGLEISRAIRNVKIFVSNWSHDHYKQNAVQAIE